MKFIAPLSIFLNTIKNRVARKERIKAPANLVVKN